MSENDRQNANMKMIRDPNLAKNRIFVGNLPACTREELESICYPYGKVLASYVQKNFGFVQFESEQLANKVAAALTKSTFKGNTINVRNAAHKQAGAKRAPGPDHSTVTKVVTSTETMETSLEDNPECNDCEIIVLDRRNTNYAELIEKRLKDLNLRVDVLFPNSDVPLGKVLINISSRGCLYAILITNQHEEHNSITVNILYGQPAEHRNMPVDDAIQLIANDFRKQMARRAAQNAALTGAMSNPVGVMKANQVAPQFKERHPAAIQALIDLLQKNIPLTVLQYDHLIKYLGERRNLQMKVELGDAAIVTEKVPDPEIELQKKILEIMNKPSVAETHYKLPYETLEDVKADPQLMDLLKDVRVQRALDSLLDSPLLGTVQKLMKF